MVVDEFELDSNINRTYSEKFYILRYFLPVVFEVMYLGLVHYGFVTLRRNYSHLILEHVLNICYYCVLQIFIKKTGLQLD